MHPGTVEESGSLLMQFLAWVAKRPRSYAETMDAWRTSCPRLSVWEDASLAGLVALADVAGAAQGAVEVVLTRQGRDRLGACGDVSGFMPTAFKNV